MITIEREPLASALGAASRLASNKNWEEMRVSAAPGFFKISATDGEHWLDLSVPCSGEIGPVCIHASRFHDVIAALPGELVGLEVEGSELRIFAGKGKRSLRLSLKEFPQREFEAGAAVTVEADKLRDVLGFTLPSIADASDPTKWNLAGVRLETHDRKLKAFATDRFAMAIAEICDCDQAIAATLSEKACSTAAKLASGEVELSLNGRAVEIRWSSGRIIGPLIDGAFFPLDTLYKVIDGEFSSTFNVEARDLLGAIRSVRPIGFFDRLSRSTGIKLRLNGNATLSTEAPEGTTEQEFEAEWPEGVEFECGFAASRMERVLAPFGDAVLSVRFSDAMKPLRFDAAARPDRIALLHPMRV